MNCLTEFERQVSNLIEKGYPHSAGLTEAKFKQLLNPLKSFLDKSPQIEIDIEKGRLPFVIVISSQLISGKEMMEKVIFNDKDGNEKLYPNRAEEFKPINFLSLPNVKAYLLLNIDRGREFLNIRPEEALETIYSRGQTPLTVEEGIAVVTQFPKFLIKKNCFSLLGSRISGNQRVPAIWINSNGQANLGWCWDRNPHTWLGSAFAEKRLG
jgi:hypothetical protein